MWWRRRRSTPPPEPCPEAQRRIERAREARESSEERLAEIRDQWPEVQEVSASLRRLRERNGFARIFNEVMRGNS